MPRSSSIAAANAVIAPGAACAPTAPIRSCTRCTNVSIRRYAADASASAPSEYSTVER